MIKIVFFEIPTFKNYKQCLFVCIFVMYILFKYQCLNINVYFIQINNVYLTLEVDNFLKICFNTSYLYKIMHL